MREYDEPFADKFSEFFRSRLTARKKEVWKLGRRDLEDVVSTVGCAIYAATGGTLSVRCKAKGVIDNYTRLHVVLWDEVARADVGMLEEMLIAQSGEYPLILTIRPKDSEGLASRGAILDKEGLQGRFFQVFADPRSPLYEKIAEKSS